MKVRGCSAGPATGLLVLLLSLAAPLELRPGAGPLGWRAAAAQVPVDVEVGASREVLSGDNEPWEDYWVRATYRPAPGTFLYGAVRHTRRFGEEDQRYEAGAGAPLGERWSARLDGTWSPTHRVAPIWGASGSVSHRPAAGWTVSAGGGRQVWENVRVDRQNVGVDRRFSRFSVGYQLGFHQTEPGGSGVRNGVHGSLFYGDGASSVTVRLSTGRDAVPVGPGDVRSTTERSAGLSGTHRLDGQTAITYNFAIRRYGDFFTRTSSSIGIQRRL